MSLRTFRTTVLIDSFLLEKKLFDYILQYTCTFADRDVTCFDFWSGGSDIESWSTASAACIAGGGTLASITSQQDLDAISSLYALANIDK